MRASWKSASRGVAGGVVVAGDGVDIAAEVEVVEDIVVEVAEGIVAAAAVVEGSIAEQEVVDVAAAGESGCFAEHKLAHAAGDKAMARSLSIEACLALEAD